jgi:hypothetical protein
VAVKAEIRLYLPSVLVLAAVAPCWAQPSSGAAATGEPLAIMQPSAETLEEWAGDYERAPWTRLDAAIEGRLLAASSQGAGSSFSLRDLIPYAPAERVQGSCNNGWLWAATGVAEIANAVQTGVRDRLSIRSLGTELGGGNGCAGGDLTRFAEGYARIGYFVSWADDGATRGGDRGDEAAGSSRIVGARGGAAYRIEAITAETIPTVGVGEARAILNIKNVLNQQRGVYLTFWLGDGAEVDAFHDFWSEQPETAIWRPTTGCHRVLGAGGGAHAVLVVGYDDTAADPGDHYWFVLNSWGTAGGRRPNGLFRMAMQADYDCALDASRGSLPALQFQTLDIQMAPSRCYTLTPSVSPPGSGTIAVNTPTNCTGGYTEGTAISLTATARSGAVFSGWTGSGGTFSSTSSATTTFTISARATVAANFTAMPNTRPYLGLGWPDKLVVSKTTGTSIDDTGLSPSDTLYVDWAAINDGAAPTAARCYFDLYVDGAIKGRFWIEPPWQQGMYIYYLDYPLGSLSAGGHTLKFVTDSTNAIVEFNEADNEYTRTITVGEAPPPAGAGFYTVMPCRVVDTREPPGPVGGPALAANDAVRTFTVAGSCGIPSDAAAVSANVTVTMGSQDGTLTIFPGDLATASTTTIAWMPSQTRANNAMIKLAATGDGTIKVKNTSSATVHFMLDVNGYFK